jgi:heme-degrading monooxygenase HmoA
MLALFFDVLPKPGHEDAYFQIAAALKPELEKNPGLLFLDRYKSLGRPGWFLSHQYWRDEASLVRWRTEPHHHVAQVAGRREHFADYRIRVAQVVTEAKPGKPLRRWSEENLYADPELTPPRYVIAVESTGAEFRAPGLEPFASVYRPGEFVAVGALAERRAAEAIAEEALAAANVGAARVALVARDYGMVARSEAPQYFPAERSA